MMQIGFPEDVVNNINLRIIADSSGNKTVEVTLDLDIAIWHRYNCGKNKGIRYRTFELHIWAAMTICLV